MAVTHDDPADEIEVFDTANQFGSVLKRAQVDFRWAPSSPRLMLFGAPDAKGLQALTEIDFSTLPPSSTSRGNTVQTSDWGFVNDGTLWAAHDEASGKSSFWLLESGSNVWRRVASDLSSATPSFTANDAYVVFGDSLPDGTTQYLAFSLHDKNPVALPLLPTPLNGDVGLNYSLNDGVIVSRLTGLEPFEGQIWWIASSASGFGKPAPLGDLRVNSEPTLQPQP
jgi:hypothetical protein